MNTKLASLLSHCFVNFLFTLKQTSKLIGIVKNTSTQERKINIFPHVDASALSVSSAIMKKKGIVVNC